MFEVCDALCNGCGMVFVVADLQVGAFPLVAAAYAAASAIVGA